MELGPVKPHVAQAAYELGTLFGFTNIGGWRKTGSVPNSDHPKGLALDFMTLNKGKGDRLVAFAKQNASRLHITYIIWYGEIWYADTEKTEVYRGPSPHVDHVHISFASNADSTTPITNPITNLPIIDTIEESAKRLQNPELWKRVGKYALGSVILILAIILLLRRPIIQGSKEVAKVVI